MPSESIRRVVNLDLPDARAHFPRIGRLAGTRSVLTAKVDDIDTWPDEIASVVGSQQDRQSPPLAGGLEPHVEVIHPQYAHSVDMSDHRRGARRISNPAGSEITLQRQFVPQLRRGKQPSAGKR